MMLNDEQEEFLAILTKTLGVVSQACDKMGITREEYDSWLTNLEFKKRVNQVNETSIDFVENKLLQKINQNDLNAIQFYLKTKGKKRGY